MQGKGYSMRRMATELTKRKVKTPRGGEWHPQTVKMVMQRLAAQLINLLIGVAGLAPTTCEAYRNSFKSPIASVTD
jgi:hypothetical protein